MKKLKLIFCVLIIIYSVRLIAQTPTESNLAKESELKLTAFTLVNLPEYSSSVKKIAVNACAGLYNRQQGGSIYINSSTTYAAWLKELNLEPTRTINADEFLNECVVKFDNCLRYSFKTQQKLLPNILTMGAVMGAVPLDETLPLQCNTNTDARIVFLKNNTPRLATEYVFKNYINQTTGMAMLNPGYEGEDPNKFNPPLSRNPVTHVDLMYKNRLFSLYLNAGCVPGTQENNLLTRIIKNNPWDKLIEVWGYNSSWVLSGGAFFEAQTRCGSTRNMGAIPIGDNLSFFSSHRRAISTVGELKQIPRETMRYEPHKTYVAFVIGDGDNIGLILSDRRKWFNERLDLCATNSGDCVPITWSMSPHLPKVAPEVINWYYEKSKITGKDYFMLPPSGHLYAYPSSLKPAAQKSYIKATEQDAQMLDTGSTVHWEMTDKWVSAEWSFLPKYAKNNIIKGVFPVNVPYMMPTGTWLNPNQYYKVIKNIKGQSVILFRPRAWRGVNGGDGNPLKRKSYLTPEDMAKELNNYPKGTVAYVYTTSDGGLTLANSIVAMNKFLSPHVQLVSADTAVRLAHEREEALPMAKKVVKKVGYTARGVSSVVASPVIQTTSKIINTTFKTTMKIMVTVVQSFGKAGSLVKSKK